MNIFDVMDAEDGMVCIVDTREQDTPRLRARLKQMGTNHVREKLNFGDYSAKFPLPDGSFFSLADKVVVERKMSIDELCHCFCQDRDRFEREFERAKEAEARVYLLVEGATWEDVYGGKYRSRMRPTALVASLLAYISRYDCVPIFCDAKTTGKLIKDILLREAKERLESLEINGKYDDKIDQSKAN